MSLNTWTRSGSEKAQNSQTIRILLKTLQYLAEDVAADDSRERSFVKVASQVIKNTFVPSDKHSVNEQVSVVFNALGWKNTQIKLTSANQAEILLGSNRHLDQSPDSVEGLRVLIKTLSKALGSHIFERDVNALVDIDIHTGPTYTIELRAIEKMKTEAEEKSDRDKKSSTPSKPPTQGSSTGTSSSQSTIPSGPPMKTSSDIDTTQIFLPVLSNKLPISRLHLILQDILLEFCQSWYDENPLEGIANDDERDNVVTLMTYLTNKASEAGSSNLEIGEQVGTYFAEALEKSIEEDQYVSPEILDGSAVGSIIRDIKARAFCHLQPGETCGSNIGGKSREICDFSMGLWAKVLSHFMEDKIFEFTNFYAAGRRDPYCLMEFEVSQN